MTDDAVDSMFSYWEDYDYSYNDFTATSVTLSGIFRPTTFSNPAAVEHARPPGSLDIHASNGSIACSFDISDQARELEIYSPLGIRVASFPIPPEEKRAALPMLQPGFYFVRLDGDVRKLLVGQ